MVGETVGHDRVARRRGAPSSALLTYIHSTILCGWGVGACPDEGRRWDRGQRHGHPTLQRDWAIWDECQASSWPSWIAEPTDKRTYLLNTRVEVCSCPLRWLLIFRALSLWPADMLLSSFGLPASAGLRQTQNVGASLCPMVRMMWWVRRLCARWGAEHFFMEKLNQSA